ncbi:hypothetical protein AMEX_G11222 [Astyanax mexicanus]|uniref:cytidine deaminase n=2 Tax=Astyanax mexicanus TaxID=7994 RepID=A0A8T2LR06_ASTMX|nr:hypothetical protein AMEX_G11222 [Astyanax mexicanus]
MQKETAERDGVRKSFIVMLNLIAWMVLTATAGLGAINFHECPIQPHIPTYLIMIGACGAVSLMLAYLKNTLHEGALNQLCSICIFCILLLSTCWILMGTFWVYSIYPPNYDSSNGRHYCQRTLYLFAFWDFSITLARMAVAELVAKCLQAREMAYCPYSRFPVGAAILTSGGTIITGCNVENASYGLTVCAERTAIQRAVAEGHRSFTAIAVTCDIKDSFVGPCGACRQVLMEFGTEWDIYLTKPDGSYKKTSLRDLLPLAFTPAHLAKE